MKKHVGFIEKVDVISAIDEAADKAGLDRSGWIKHTIREKLRAETDSNQIKLGA
jgi:hypothetical protein